MTTITSNYTEARFSKRNSALLLIDHQSGIMQLNRDYSMKHTSIRTIASEQKFDRGTGTGEPTAETARPLNLMKQVDDALNLRDYEHFLDQLHSPMKILVIGGTGYVGLRDRPPRARRPGVRASGFLLAQLMFLQSA